MQIGGGGERLEIRENFTSYPSKITKQKALQFLVQNLVISRLLERGRGG